jgi:hypothetical protein
MTYMTYEEKPADPAALADASTDADAIEDDKCAAWGPQQGECCRDRGHRDGAWAQNLHVTFDHDHYQSWFVGWRPVSYYAKAVVDEYVKFEEHLGMGNKDLSLDLLSAIRALQMALQKERKS